MLDEGVSGLIADIYAGAHDKGTWDAAMDRLCQRLGASWLLIASFDEQQRVPIEPGWHRIRGSRFLDGVAEYAAQTSRFDPTNHFAAHNPLGGAFDSRRASAPNDYLDHQFVRWNRAHFGSTFWKLHYAGRDGLKLGASLHLSEERGPLDAGDAALYAMLFRHMEAAARLAARPPLLVGNEPVLLLDVRGEMVAASDAAARLLARGDGIALIDRRPRATSRRCEASFDRAIRSALSARTHGGSGGSATLERRDGSPLLATVTPLPVGESPLPVLSPQAMVRLTDPDEAPADPVADWISLFAFTPAEARLARALLAGSGSLRETADGLGIAYATARAQLARLFDKAGVASQSQLIRLLTRLG